MRINLSNCTMISLACLVMTGFVPTTVYSDQPTPSKNGVQFNKQVNKLFPDGTHYDFGPVALNTMHKHSLRIVNTTNKPLKIISLRMN